MSSKKVPSKTKCSECGETVSRVGWLFNAPIYSHEPGDRTCLQIQLQKKDEEIELLKRDLVTLAEYPEKDLEEK